MHEETTRELIENGSSLVGTLLKEMLIHRNKVQVMEQRKENELELAKARAEHGQQRQEAQMRPSEPDEPAPPTDGVQAPHEPVSATPAEIEEALDELIEDEMCDVCRELLIALKERPAKQQVKGVMEYGTFKQNLDDGAGVEQLKETIRETTILHDIFQQKYTGQGAQA